MLLPLKYQLRDDLIRLLVSLLEERHARDPAAGYDEKLESWKAELSEE